MPAMAITSRILDSAAGLAGRLRGRGGRSTATTASSPSGPPATVGAPAPGEAGGHKSATAPKPAAPTEDKPSVATPERAEATRNAPRGGNERPPAGTRSPATDAAAASGDEVADATRRDA